MAIQLGHVSMTHSSLKASVGLLQEALQTSLNITSRTSDK